MTMSADLLELLDRVARAMESVVPGLSLTAQIGNRVWLEAETDNIEDTVASEDEGEWVTALGFSISYRTVDRQPDRTDRRQFSCTDKRQRFAPTSVVPLALTGVRGLHRHATVPSHRHA